MFQAPRPDDWIEPMSDANRDELDDIIDACNRQIPGLSLTADQRGKVANLERLLAERRVRLSKSSALRPPMVDDDHEVEVNWTSVCAVCGEAVYLSDDEFWKHAL